MQSAHVASTAVAGGVRQPCFKEDSLRHGEPPDGSGGSRPLTCRCTQRVATGRNRLDRRTWVQPTPSPNGQPAASNVPAVRMVTTLMRRQLHHASNQPRPEKVAGSAPC